MNRTPLPKQPFWRLRLEVHQVMLTGLQRVDRCTTCHLGVDDPTMKDAPEPYRYHANLGPHIPSKFGCTICHGGQGLATDKENAHGSVAFWPNPLLSPTMFALPAVDATKRATCRKCRNSPKAVTCSRLKAAAAVKN